MPRALRRLLTALSFALLGIGGCGKLSGIDDLHPASNPDASVGGSPSDTGGTGTGGRGSGGSKPGTGGTGPSGGGATATGGGFSGGTGGEGPDSGSGGTDGGSGGADGGSGCKATEIVCNGTCVPNDIHNCGECGHDCTLLTKVTGAVTCTAGACTYPPESCEAGFLNCSGNLEDGCDSAIDIATRCGACTTACTGGTPVCSPVGGSARAFACSSGCPAGTTLCSGSCVNLQTDPQHCGSCTKVCAGATGGTATCAGGTTCGVQCTASTHVCTGACVSNADPKNCGTLCGTNCPAPTSGGGTAACSGNVCALSCPPGSVSCGGACVITTGSDSNNCGGCGLKCGTGKSCQSGSCKCASGTDCSGTCVNTSGSDSNNCGGCGLKCGDGKSCSAGTCVCPGGTTDCSGTCSNLQTSATSCGRCGHSCFAGTCDTGTCTQWTVAEPPTTTRAFSFTSDGTYVVWGDRVSKGVYRVNIGGGGKVTMAEDASFDTLQDAIYWPMSAANGTVAWLSGTKVWTAAIATANSGKAFPFTFPAGNGLYNLALDTSATHAAVMLSVDSGGGFPNFALYDCTLSGTTCVNPGTFTYFPQGAVGSATNFYFPDLGDNTIYIHKFGSLNYAPQATGQPSPALIALDSKNLYWINEGSPVQLMKMPILGGTIAPLVSSFPGTSAFPLGLASDGTNVYFTLSGSPPTVYYVPVGGGTLTPLATGSNISTVIAVGGKVLWLDGDGIYGIAAP